MVTALTELFSVRSVCMTGSVMLTTGLVIGFAGGSLEAIILPYGIIGGLGVGMILNPAPLIISRYFHKRKALAMGILFAGTGVGGILGPFVITAFLDYFGLHGTILMIGAISLNTAVGASLFRPLSYWDPEPAPSQSESRLSVKASTIPLLEAGEEAKSKEALGEEEVMLPGHLHVSSLSLSNLDLPTTLLEASEHHLPTIGETETRRPALLKRLLHRETESGELVPILTTAVLGEPLFVLFSAGCLCGMSGFYWGMLTPAYCEEDLGMSAEESARLLSLMGVGDLAGRLLMAGTGDGLLLGHRPLAVGLSLLLIGSCVLICPFLPGFWTQAAALVTGQLGFGCFVALSPVALGDLVPADGLSSAWGFLLFAEGLGHIATPLLIGAIKDGKGTYFGGYFLVSSVCFLGGALIIASNCLHKLRHPLHLTQPPTPSLPTNHTSSTSANS